MNNNQSKQALEGGILNDVGLRLGKSFVTCTLLLGLTWGVPLGAAMDSPDTGRGGVAQPADAGAAVGAFNVYMTIRTAHREAAQGGAADVPALPEPVHATPASAVQPGE